jgi:hypothetical protein
MQECRLSGLWDNLQHEGKQANPINELSLHYRTSFRGSGINLVVLRLLQFFGQLAGVFTGQFFLHYRCQPGEMRWMQETLYL